MIGASHQRRVMLRGLLAVGATWAAPAGGQATAARMPRIVFASNRDEAGARPFVESFVQGMQEHGYVENRNYILDVRYAGGEPSRIAPMVREAVASRPDILVIAGLFAARVARDETKTIPVIVATGSDLVDVGIVRSYSRPGGNITGIADLTDEAAVKRLELLKGVMPKATRVALLTNPEFPATPKIERLVRAAAERLGITLIPAHATDRASLIAAVDSLAKVRPDALLVGGDNNAVSNAEVLIERATALRIPVAYFWPGAAEAGALFSYQADIFYNFRRAASYADRILKGARPGDLPIELPTRYELVVNQKVAKEFGIAIPNAILLRANRIVE